jgi:hypothetical protein
MIRVDNQRFESNGDPCGGVDQRKLSVAKAFVALLRYNFGYGALIQNMNDSYICVKTPCLGSVTGSRYDIVKFYGSITEMSMLVQATIAFLGLKEIVAQSQELNEAEAEAVLTTMQGKPLYIAAFSHLLMNHHPACIAAACAICSRESHLLIPYMHREEFWTIIELKLEEPNRSIKEILCVVGDGVKK